MKQFKLTVTDHSGSKEIPSQLIALQSKFPEVDPKNDFVARVAWEVDQQTVNLHAVCRWLIQDIQQLLQGIEANGAAGVWCDPALQNALNVNVVIGKVNATFSVLTDMIQQREEAAKLTTAPSH